MAMPLGTDKDTFFVLDEDAMSRLKSMTADLQAGSDKERDTGHALSLLLEQAAKYNGYELYST